MKKFFTHISKYIRDHKMITAIIVLVILGGGYYLYHRATAATADPQYTLSRVRLGSITQTVTGTGQISSQNQLDVKSLVSGNITAIKVSVGDHVRAGDLLATVDSSQAALNLQNAKLSFEKLTQPAKTTDILNSQNNLNKAYNDEYSNLNSTFLDLPGVMAGMKDMLYGKDTYLSAGYNSDLSYSSKTYRETFGVSYDKAADKYAILLQSYSQISRTSATSSIDQLASDTYDFLKQLTDTLRAGQAAVNFISTTQPEYQTKLSAPAVTDITTWSNQINSDLTSVLASQNTIQSDINSLNTLITGADPLDVQSQQISLSQQEQTYANYFIRAPFDGIVGRIPVNVYDQASGATIATIIGDNKVATISLNEVDAAKVQTGQPATISFDAISDFTATGTVSQVDLVGTVTQGVVTYNVKIAVNTNDPRIKPGMSVNTTITTKQKDGVLVVPSSAVKTQGQNQYVQIFDNPTLPTTASSTSFGVFNGAASSTYGAFASSSARAGRTRTATTTVGFGSQAGTSTFIGRNNSVTITSAIPPRDQAVTIGDSDDTNTEIVNGLTPGQWIVTRTIAGTSQTTTVAPSILNSLGGSRGGAGATRIPGAATGR